MSSIKNIELPDIGDFDEVEVIEILVSVGDTIAADDSIITLESDKASMEIPSPSAGTVTQININIGDKIKQGDSLISLESTQESEESTTEAEESSEPAAETSTKIVPVVVPDIGDFDEVEVIEILVSVGDELNEEDSIITLESDKASMEIPTPVSGTVSSINISLGVKLKLGDLILEMQSSGTTQAEAVTQEAPSAP
ncbi:MAG TPA: branched-chain alpha-keto acid dehydrogenase subunit E2, partial [Gammaproteobacteria bacterium]|nr:branched-chain alpha-keto acid dehydrogenase subunit E2 [Gammaproteobacteria bacterium]